MAQPLAYLIAGFLHIGGIVLGEFAFQHQRLNQRQIVLAHDQRQPQQVRTLTVLAAGEPVQQGVDRQELRHGGGRRRECAANRSKTHHLTNPFALPDHRPQR